MMQFLCLRLYLPKFMDKINFFNKILLPAIGFWIQKENAHAPLFVLESLYPCALIWAQLSCRIFSQVDLLLDAREACS